MNTDTKILNKIKGVGTTGYQNKKGREAKQKTCLFLYYTQN